MLFIPTIALALIQLFLAGILLNTYIRSDQKNAVLQLCGITLSLIIWTFVNTLLLVESSNENYISLFNTINFVGFFWGGLATIQIFIFSYYFPVVTKMPKIIKLYILFLLLILGITASSELIVGSHYLDEVSGVITYTPGSSNYIFILFILITVTSYMVHSILLMKQKHEYKHHIKTMMMGLGATSIHGIIFILLLPAIFGEQNIFYVIGYMAPAYFVIATSYGLIKQQLFNFKTVFVRAIGYIFTTIIALLLYVSVAFLLKRILFPDLQVNQTQFYSNIVLTVALILLYPYLKKTFDKVSNKIFFRDAYDPQELIDRLNQTLVTNVNLEELLTKSSLIMQEEMKSSFTTFYIRETSYFDNRVIGAHRKTPEFEDIESIEKYATKIHKKVFLSESVSDNENDKKLSLALKNNDVEVMARLTNTLDFEVKGIGYIFMGPKRSGSPYSSNDLKILEIIANELVIAIENVLRFEEIEQFNVTLQKKIDDATKELKQSNDKLRALDEAKDEFVSMASHQLRTPLTSIKGYLSMVLEGDAGDITDTQKKMLGQAFFSSQRMVYLISDLLNVSRLKTGKFVIETKPVYLPDIVESELEQLYEGASAKNLKLTFTKPKSFATMTLDEMKLRQVIMNFTDNAIYYTPSGGKINVELKETAKSVEFTVKDSGIGVPKDQQHKLFTKFYRADNARKARPDGTGLGLFMAKKVIIAQGGSMIFESKEGKGSTFGFSFPKEKLEVKEASDK